MHSNFMMSLDPPYNIRGHIYHHFLIETHLTPKTTPKFHLTPNNIRTVLMQVIVTILFELFKKFVLLNFDDEFGLSLKVK